MKRLVPRRSAVARLRRRAVLVGLAAGVSFGLAVSARGEDEPEKPGSDERPQPGDVLVFAEDDHAGQPVKPADLVSGATLTPAWPMDPVSRVVRDGSRLNALLLLRLDPQELDDATRSASADGGIVAYSAICAHAGCPVTGFLEEQGQRVLKCFCHNSVYDPHRQAAVVSGPAPRRLAGLPVTISDGELVVKARFNGKVGPTQSG
jgi:rieske iron-sulfur protein